MWGLCCVSFWVWVLGVSCFVGEFRFSHDVRPLGAAQEGWEWHGSATARRAAGVGRGIAPLPLKLGLALLFN